MSRFTRIEKLESRRRDDNEMLMLWRKPGQAIDATVLAANRAELYAPGDLVVCAEWFGEDNLPAPRWIRHFETDLTEIENEYCDRTIEKLISKAGDAGFFTFTLRNQPFKPHAAGDAK
jgi:hypothetical protein